jgi:hypothetical protein
MAASTLNRCAGLAGLASGLLISLAFVVHPKANAQGMQSGIYVPLHVVILLCVVPALLCLTAAYLPRAEQLGVLGLVGFALSFSGLALLTVVMALDGLVSPLLKAHGAGNLRDIFTGSAIYAVMTLQGVLLALGFALFGLAIIRARSPLRWATLLAAVGAFTLGVQTAAPFWLESRGGLNLGGALLGLGIGWLGYLQWRGETQQVPAAFPQVTAEASGAAQ